MRLYTQTIWLLAIAIAVVIEISFSTSSIIYTINSIEFFDHDSPHACSKLLCIGGSRHETIYTNYMAGSSGVAKLIRIGISAK